MDLYKTIVQLPFSEKKSSFESNYDFVIKNKNLTEDMKTYLRKKVESKEKWAKCYMKTYFCSGMCTSSRIEAKHRILKQFTNSSTQLTQIFQVIKSLEEKEIFAFKDEIKRLTNKENLKLEKTSLIKYFKDDYSQYALAILKDELIESTNYKIVKKTGDKWYFSFSLLN